MPKHTYTNTWEWNKWNWVKNNKPISMYSFIETLSPRYSLNDSHYSAIEIVATNKIWPNKVWKRKSIDEILFLWRECEGCALKAPSLCSCSQDTKDSWDNKTLLRMIAKQSAAATRNKHTQRRTHTQPGIQTNQLSNNNQVNCVKTLTLWRLLAHNLRSAWLC